MGIVDRYYRAKYGTGTLVVTIVTCFLLAATIFTLLFIPLAAILSAVTIILILAVCYIYSTRGYHLTEEKLIIQRIGPNVEINCKKITDIVLIENISDYGSVLRLGNGGLFGYFGYFRSDKLGNFKAYCKAFKGAVMVSTADGRKALLSPEDPENFIRDVKLAMKISAKTTE